VTFDDSVWQVRSETGETLAPGTEVEVIGADGVTLLVRRVRD
jgi:membrane protein implicated in regulation of membrane protease activity